MCPKIVQKYIEKPFLINNRKFDIRQWVFVSSFDPLEVFIYKDAYMRICSKDFELEMFEDIQRHISNFSVNKDEELVMSSHDFITYLQQHTTKFKHVTWESHFLPQIERIARAVSEKAGETVESRNNFFELFGFDFAVDIDLKLWLIEINMSPACAERQPWLTTMLDDMANGVSGIISAKINQTDVQQGCIDTQWYMMNHKTHFYIQKDGKKVKVKIP